jgi:hypothetical protein
MQLRNSSWVLFLSCLTLSFLHVLAPGLHSASANDSTATTAGPGLRLEKTDRIAMKKEVLRISPKKVQVEYVFLNESKDDLETIVAFPLPPYGNIYDGSAGGGESQFPDFEVSMNGASAKVQTKSEVRFEGKDVTEELKRLKMPVDRFLKLSEIQANTLDDLKKRGWYSDQHPDGDLNAVYSIQKTHFWNQRFPAGKKVESKHSYTPELGGNSIGAVSFGESWKPFLDLDQEQDRPTLAAYYFDYILSTGSNWKSGIEDFQLQVDGASVILVEIDGQVDFDLGSYRFKKKGFKPKKELRIEYLGIGGKPVLTDSLRLSKEIDGPANCRDSPAGKVLQSFPDRERVRVKARKGDWYRIQVKSTSCWTHRKNLRFLPEARD